jgi:hypothetical protein
MPNEFVEKRAHFNAKRALTARALQQAQGRAGPKAERSRNEIDAFQLCER